MRRVRWLTIVSLVTVGVMLIGATLLAVHRRHVVLGSEEHEHGEWMGEHDEHEHAEREPAQATTGHAPSAAESPTEGPGSTRVPPEASRPEAAHDVPAEGEDDAHDGRPHGH